ncbi:MAG: L,D-transpeptidase [Cyanobacteria bacterium J06636_28]
MKHKGIHSRWQWLIGAVLWLPMPVFAGSSPTSRVPPSIAVEVDYTPSRQPAPNAADYALGEAADYLPDVQPQPTQIVLRLGERRVYVYNDDDEVLASYPVAIGTDITPTPIGEFEVFQMIEDPVWQSPWTGEVFPPGANSALGLRWIGFAEQSNGIIGFHGTPTVSSIGHAASNGCVRLRNEDVLALFEYTRMGMTVVVEP